MRPPAHLRSAVLLAALAPLSLRAQQRGTVQESRDHAPRGVQTIVVYPDSVDGAPRTLSELLAARAPGVVVQRASGASGEGAWISFRDAGAISEHGPLVVVDGVRRVPMDIGSTTTTARFGASTLDDIPLDQVERVELLRGPAAAARYGGDARWGAIVVTTRTPRADGGHFFHAALTGGVAQNAASFPTNFAYMDGSGQLCYFYASCATPTTWTPLNDYQLFREGGRAALSADAATSLGAARLALGATVDRTRGVLASDGTDRGAGTVRFVLPFAERSSLAFAAQAVVRGIALPNERKAGVTYAGINGYAKDCSATDPCGPNNLASSDSTSHGYGTGMTPGELALDGERERTQHFSEGLALETGAGPVALRTTASVDHYALHGHQYHAPYVFSPYGFPAGPAPAHATNDRRATRIDAEQQASVDERVPLGDGATLVAFRFQRDESRVSDAAFATSDRFVTRVASYEVRAEQTARIAGRVDADVGVRWWRPQFPKYNTLAYPPRLDPWGSLAVDVGDGAQLRGLGTTTLRLRAAAGQVTSYDRLTTDLFADPFSGGFGYSFGGPYPSGGTPAYPPEAADRSSEVEGGFDVVAAAGATHFSVTVFRRADRYEELYLPVPQPSSGFGAFEPLGRVTRGLELSLDARPVVTPRFTWRLGAFATFTKDVIQSRAGPIYGDYALTPFYTTADGRPAGEWWAEPLTWADTNHDGHLSYREVGVGGPPASAGRSRPSRIAGLTSSLALGSSIAVGATLDYRGGHKVLDFARALQCQRSQCPAIYGTPTDLGTQAGAVMAASRGPLTGFLEPGDALRLNDLSLTVTPRWLAARAGGAPPRLTLAARDIRLWSRAHTFDDETALPAPGLAGTIDIPQPLTRSLELRLDLAY